MGYLPCIARLGRNYPDTLLNLSLRAYSLRSV